MTTRVVVHTPRIARRLLRRGYRVVDIAPNRDTGRTDFIFSEEIINGLSTTGAIHEATNSFNRYN